MSEKLRPIIDSDMLHYQVGFGVEFKDDDGNVQVNSFDSCITLLEKVIDEIMEETWATESPIFYLTADEKLINSLNKRRTAAGDEPIEYRPNFREAIAVTKPYKGTRTGTKPYHFDNLRMHILGTYDTKIAMGIEADDLLSIDHVQESEVPTILCSRDKDLRITPGLHYGWSCGKQTSFGPREISELGYLNLTEGKTKKLSGGGLKFFYAQMITGDTVDNIPGIPGKGAVFAYNLLSDLESEEDLFRSVIKAYKEKKLTKKYFNEQANLLWMIQSLDEVGEPIFYKMPEVA